ncbi:hypothetical protein AAFF_G00374180 [Aldrovandia affinis]|uniref:Uncharacterized protein n=1 Tax=Aldrovandia affinis TaxID=143900 RepID=A0AAD7R4Q4_9TELE|nr:hypothetical protein AAFF_G00374180 [Aldrovandia affinis]
MGSRPLDGGGFLASLPLLGRVLPLFLSPLRRVALVAARPLVWGLGRRSLRGPPPTAQDPETPQEWGYSRDPGDPGEGWLIAKQQRKRPLSGDSPGARDPKGPRNPPHLFPGWNRDRQSVFANFGWRRFLHGDGLGYGLGSGLPGPAPGL